MLLLAPNAQVWSRQRSNASGMSSILYILMTVQHHGPSCFERRLRCALHHRVFADPPLRLRADLLNIPESIFLIEMMTERTRLNPCRNEQSISKISSPFHLDRSRAAPLVIWVREEDVQH